MPTYIGFASYTDQGIRNVKDSPNRLDATKNLVKDLGGELKQFYLTMGAYDIVIVFDLPGDDAAAKFALSLCSLCNVRTTTVKAFTEAEYRVIVASLP